MEISKLLKDMSLSIVDLPIFLSKTSLYSNPTFGIGLLHVPVVVASRLLDNVWKLLQVYKINELVTTGLRYLHVLHSTAEFLYFETQDSTLPDCNFNDISQVIGTMRFWEQEIQN